MDYHQAHMSFLTYLKIKNYAPATQSSYGEQLKPFYGFLQEKKVRDLRAVTHQQILDYQDRISEQPLAPQTQALRIRAVKRLFEHLTDANLLLMNPAQSIIETPVQGRLPKEILTQEEIQKILSQPNISLSSGIRDRALLELFYTTGIRIGEMVKLTVYDIEIQSGLLHIRSGKGRKARVVPIGRKAGVWLKEYLTRIRPRQNRLYRQERALFLTQRGRPVTPRLIRSLIKETVESAGIQKHVTAHTFRHTCATHLIQNGADIVSVSELLGHASLNTTVLYTRIAPLEVKHVHRKTHPRESA